MIESPNLSNLGSKAKKKRTVAALDRIVLQRPPAELCRVSDGKA